MTTLYQLHSTIDDLRHSIEEMGRTWCRGDYIILLGATVAYIDWLQVYLTECEIDAISEIYALQSDIDALSEHTKKTLKLENKPIVILTDSEWVTTIHHPQFTKVVTLS